MDSRKLARLCRELAESKKADDVVILDVRKLTSIADYFVFATGTSEPHLKAIIDEISDGVREQHDLRPRARDGSAHNSWIVLDFDDVIVHVMRAETRRYYSLETMWGDAPKVRATRKKTTAPTPFSVGK